MSYVIQSRGSTNKAEVSANHLRTLAVNTSLMNHLSSEINGRTAGPEENPNAGVYTIRNSGVANSNSSTNMIGLQNLDPFNFMIIDRIYVQAFSSGALPDPSTFIALSYGGDNLAIFGQSNINNDNRSISNKPIISAGNIDTLSATELIRIYPDGGANELLEQKVDSLILKSAPSTSSAAPKAINNISFIKINITTGNNSAFFNTLIRFSMVHPGDLERT